jgi:membrane protein DedA with SNARE-associated domain
MFGWITSFIGSMGIAGVALLMFVENLFPPIPSELIMPLAGFTAARGEMNFVLALAAGSFGSLLGAVFWYYIGLRVGAERLKRWSAKHGRWLTLSPEEIDQSCAWFHRHGGKAVLIGRLVPAVRTLISVPAGIAKMPFTPFLLYSAIGTIIWTALLAGAGYLLEHQYQKVSEWINPVSNVVIGLLVCGYIYRVATFRRKEIRL